MKIPPEICRRYGVEPKVANEILNCKDISDIEKRRIKIMELLDGL